MFRLFTILLCLSLSPGLQAVQRYQSSVDDSQWLVHSSPIYCEMVHAISYYGNARFVYSSGGELAFQLQVLQSAPRESVASLYSIAPFWRKAEKKELAQLTISKGRIPIYVEGKLALRIFYELQAGRHPTFHYKDWAVFEDDVYVSISSVNFYQQLDDFQRCMSQALPYGSDHVKDTTVYFANNRYNLAQEQRKRLNEIVLFAKIDKSMKIQLNGHADGRGRRTYNKKLSARRIGAVEKYLISQGVPAAQIRQLALGESRPLASNRSERGRKNNRRVEVLIKHE